MQQIAVDEIFNILLWFSKYAIINVIESYSFLNILLAYGNITHFGIGCVSWHFIEFIY